MSHAGKLLVFTTITALVVALVVVSVVPPLA